MSSGDLSFLMDLLDHYDTNIIYYLLHNIAVSSEWCLGIYNTEQGELCVKLSAILFDI